MPVNSNIEELDEEIRTNKNTKWQRYTAKNKPESLVPSTQECIYYYNSATREVRWKLTNLHQSSNDSLSFQLLVKVVDEEVLLGVKEGKYTNTVKTYQYGGLLESDTSPTVTFRRKALTKEESGASGNTMSFRIVVNDDDEDLFPKSYYATIVDELSSDLTVDVSTIEIKDSGGAYVKTIRDEDGNLIRNVTVGLEYENGKTILKFTVPDNKKLIITYTAKVTSPPDGGVTISNVAYWEGYPAYEDSVVKVENYTYSYTGMAEVKGHAYLKLTKRDSEDVMTTLSGAQYTMQKATLNSDGTFTLDDTVYTGTTDENGQILFSADGSNWMEYNQIYCLKETVCPEGYVLDTTPHYILLASKDNEDTYPTTVSVQRNAPFFDYTAVDSPIPRYSLPSTGGVGTTTFKVAGAALVTAAIGGYTIMYSKRKRRKRNK
jgi:LPXTG-motif cell wall-anchored protein